MKSLNKKVMRKTLNEKEKKVMRSGTVLWAFLTNS